MKTLLSFFLVLIPTLLTIGQSKEFYSTIKNATILLYKKSGSNIIPHGTAFCYYNYEEKNDDNILVTCEHITHHDTLVAVIPATDSIKKYLIANNRNKLFIRSNSGIQNITFDGNNLLIAIPLLKDKNLFIHKYLDLAIILTPIPNSVSINGKSMKLNEFKNIPKSLIAKTEEIYSGQEITFLGFPYGIGSRIGFQGTFIFGDIKPNPLIRKGIVSWKSESAPIMLIDGFSYSGNSGSPTFSIPTNSDPGKFIGMVIGHLNDTFELNNMFIDTLKKVIIPEKKIIDVNNGLARCIPSYIITEFVESILKRK